MKHLIFFLLFILSVNGFAQSKSFEVLKDKFDDEEDVHSFKLSGFLCRAAIRIALSDEDEQWYALSRGINHVRFIVVPKEAFAAQQVSVSGFKQYLGNDGFDQLLTIQDDGETITLFEREEETKKHRYFLLVEGATEVVAFEMKGYIDPTLLNDTRAQLTMYRQ
jgi:hypothetical protein